MDIYWGGSLMEGLRKKLHQHDTLFYVITAIISIGFVFTYAYEEQLPLWAAGSISSLLIIFMALNAVAYFKVLKQKYLKTIETLRGFTATELTAVHEQLTNQTQLFTNEQATNTKAIQGKLMDLDHTYAEKLKQLQQQFDLSKQLILSKVQEEMLAQTTLLQNDMAILKEQQLQLASASKEQLEQTYNSLQKDLSKETDSINENLHTVGEKVSEAQQNLIDVTTKNTANVTQLVEQKTTQLIDTNNIATTKVVTQTKDSEKLLTEVLTTLTQNVLVASNLLKGSLNEQHEQVIGKLVSVDERQQQLMQYNHDKVLEKLLYLIDTQNTLAKDATLKNDEHYNAFVTLLTNQASEILDSIEQAVQSDKQQAQSIIEQFETQNVAVKDIVLAQLEQDVAIYQEEQQKQTTALEQMLNNVLQSLNDCASSIHTVVNEKTELLQEQNVASKNDVVGQLIQLEQKVVTTTENQFEQTTVTIDAIQQSLVTQFEKTNELGNVRYEQLRDRLSMQQGELNDYISSSSQYVQQLVQQSVQKLNETIEQLQSELQSILAQQNQQSKQHVQQLEQQLMLSKEDIAVEVKDFVEASTKQYESLNARIAIIPTEQQKLTADIQQTIADNFKQQLDEWQSLKNQAVVQLDEVRKQLTNSAKEHKQVVQNSIMASQKEVLQSFDQVHQLSNQSLQKLIASLTDIHAISKQQNDETLQKLANLNNEITSMESDLLKQLNDVSKQLDRQNTKQVFEQLEKVQKGLADTKSVFNKTSNDLTQQIDGIQKAVVNPKTEVNESLSYINNLMLKMKLQMDGHEELLFDRIEYINVQLSEIQKLANLNRLNQIEQVSSDKKTADTKATNSVMSNTTKQATATKTKQKNRTEVIEDKANNLKIHNTFVDAKLSKSDMYQNNKKTYSVFYEKNGEMTSSVNYDDNGNVLTETKYYPNGAVMDRIENVKANGKIQRQITSFDINGKRLK